MTQPRTFPPLARRPDDPGHHRRRRSRFFASKVLLVLGSAALGWLSTEVAPAAADVRGAMSTRDAVGIAVIFDGPGRYDDLVRRALTEEILALTEGEIEVRWTETLNGDWDPETVARAVDQAYADDATDLVISFGPVASDAVSRRGPLPKPTVAAAIIDAELQGLPTEVNGGSGVENLVYVALPRNLEDELRAFYSVVPFTKIALVAEAGLINSIPNLRQAVGRQVTELGLDYQIIDVGTDLDGFFERFDSDVEAVYVWPQLQLSTAELNAFIEGLIERGLPSFSSLGGADVEAGILAGQRSSDLIRRLARRTALNLQRILLGEKASEIPVQISLPDDLTINMATAQKLNLDPRWQTLIEAKLIQVDRAVEGEGLSLKQAIQRSVEQNLDLAARRQGVTADNRDVAIARAKWKPQLEIGATALVVDDDRAEASFGSQAERTGTVNLQLSQLLVSDSARANVDIQELLQAARQAELEGARLDVAVETAVTYLNLLRAQTLQRIQRGNLELTRSNLDLAEVRREVGSANAGEVYRWQSQVAQDRQSLINAAAGVKVAQLALNRLLHRPLEDPIQTREVTLDDRELLLDVEDFQGFFATPRHFETLRDFNVEMALEQSPGLHLLRRQVEIQERRVTAARRAFYFPTVAAQVSLDHLVVEEGAGADVAGFPGSPLADDTNWSLAINGSLPLYTGGARRVERIQAQELLSQLELQLKAGMEQLGQEVRAASIEARTSYFRIGLAREAAEAASKGRDLVSDAYARGAVSIIDLLDGQNAALNAELAAADAVYDFFIDLLTLERLGGSLSILEPPEERQQWIRRLTDYFIAAGVQPWTPSPLDS